MILWYKLYRIYNIGGIFLCFNCPFLFPLGRLMLCVCVCLLLWKKSLSSSTPLASAPFLLKKNRWPNRCFLHLYGQCSGQHFFSFCPGWNLFFLSFFILFCTSFFFLFFFFGYLVKIVCKTQVSLLLCALFFRRSKEGYEMGRKGCDVV